VGDPAFAERGVGIASITQTKARDGPRSVTP
jgi:hypothetical protein